MTQLQPQPTTTVERTVSSALEAPLFAGLERRALDLVQDVMRTRRYGTGDVLFREFDPSDAVYVMRSGVVKLSKVDLAGHEKTLTLLRPPSVFGEMGVIGDYPRSASAIAAGPVEVSLIFSDDFERLMTQFPTLALNVNRMLADRLRSMDVESQILSYQDAQGRVAYVLLRLVRDGIASERDGVPLVRLTHQELANLAGTSRETVTRALKTLDHEGVIATKPKEILLADVIGLEEILHDVR